MQNVTIVALDDSQEDSPPTICVEGKMVAYDERSGKMQLIFTVTQLEEIVNQIKSRQ